MTRFVSPLFNRKPSRNPARDLHQAQVEQQREIAYFQYL